MNDRFQKRDGIFPPSTGYNNFLSVPSLVLEFIDVMGRYAVHHAICNFLLSLEYLCAFSEQKNTKQT